MEMMVIGGPTKVELGQQLLDQVQVQEVDNQTTTQAQLQDIIYMLNQVHRTSHLRLLNYGHHLIT